MKHTVCSHKGDYSPTGVEQTNIGHGDDTVEMTLIFAAKIDVISTPYIRQFKGDVHNGHDCHAFISHDVSAREMMYDEHFDL